LDHQDTVIARARELDTGLDAVIATDSAGVILFWNDAAEQLYGWRSDEVTGRHVVDVTPTQMSSDSALDIMEHLRDGEEWHGPFIVRRRDGSPILADVRDIPILGEEKSVIGIVGVSRRLRG
jgi:PAS domain S-box-containing protein